jgi:hypothetical protein
MYLYFPNNTRQSHAVKKSWQQLTDESITFSAVELATPHMVDY